MPSNSKIHSLYYQLLRRVEYNRISILLSNHRVLKIISHILPDLAIEFLHLHLELCLQVIDMFLILEHLLPQLVSLVHHGLMLPSQFLVVSLALASEVLLDLVCEVLV
jgi:hypothetical protein